MFRRLQDVYYSALRLQTDTASFLAGRAGRDIASHLSGECCCARNARAVVDGASTADYVAALRQLREGVKAFKSYFAKQAGPYLAGELGLSLYRIETAVNGVRRLVEEIESDLSAPRTKSQQRTTCAGAAMLRLKEPCERLGARVVELDNVLGEPDPTNSKWLAARREQSCGAQAHGAATNVAREAEANARPEAGSGAADAPLSVEELRQLVRRHSACYEVSPEWSAGGGPATRNGYRLTLCGVNEGDGQEANRHVPGCTHSRRTYDELREVIKWVTPKEERDCHFEIAAYDRAWHVAPAQRRSRGETLVTIRVLRRSDVNAPADECQLSCLQEMRAKLAEIGVHEGVWQSA